MIVWTKFRNTDSLEYCTCHLQVKNAEYAEQKMAREFPRNCAGAATG